MLDESGFTNVQRQSGLSAVQLRFLHYSQAAILEVRDYGRSMLEINGCRHQCGAVVLDSGVGFALIRERLDDLKCV